MKKYLVIATIILAGIAFAGYAFVNSSDEPKDNDQASSQASNEYNFTSISAGELQTMLENKDFQLIDVHIPEQEHVKNSDAFIPYNDIDSIVNQIGDDKDAKVVLYCRSGSMSKDAAKKLVDLGYTNIYELDGGINEWVSSGYETVDYIASDQNDIETNAYTMLEVEQHNTLEDCWTVKDKKVYEIPYEWTEQHPGGQEAFYSACGKDITEIFQVHNTELPKEILDSYYLGELIN